MAKRYGEEINMIKKIEETLKLCDEIEKKQQKIYKVDMSSGFNTKYIRNVFLLRNTVALLLMAFLCTRIKQ